MSVFGKHCRTAQAAVTFCAAWEVLNVPPLSRHRNNNSKSPAEKDALNHSLNSSRFRSMTTLCHASSTGKTWTLRRCSGRSALHLSTRHCRALGPAIGSCQTCSVTHQHSHHSTTLPDSTWHRAQLGVHLDNEQMSFNRFGQLQRPRLIWMASVVCRPSSLTSCCAYGRMHFHPKSIPSTDTFIQTRFHPMTLSSRNGFIQ